LATDKSFVGSKIYRGTEIDLGVLPSMTNIPAILIVEDEGLVRLLGVGTFADAGFRVIEAINGEDAFHLLEADSNVQLLFTDVRMPGKIGRFGVSARGA
jgi:CheY-like chemotaxis protein